MSTDQLAQVLKYVSAMAREVGEFRQEFISFRDRTEPRLDGVESRLDKIDGRLDAVEGRLDSIEREQRQTRRFMDRVHALLLTWSSDADELRERIEVLEEKKA